MLRSHVSSTANGPRGSSPSGGPPSVGGITISGMTNHTETIPPLTIDDVLAVATARLRRGRSTSESLRIDDAVSSLRRVIERKTLEIIECGECRGIVEAERLVDPEGAVARMVLAENLLHVLPWWIHPPWLAPSGSARRMQFQLLEAILDAAEVMVDDRSPDIVDHFGDLRNHARFYPHRSA
jgi:hypothetical protein